MRTTALLVAASCCGGAAVASAFTGPPSRPGRVNLKGGNVVSSPRLSPRFAATATSPKSIALCMGMPWVGRQDEGRRGDGGRVGLFQKRASNALAGVGRLISVIRRTMAIIAAASIVFFGSVNLHTPPSHASSAATTATTARIVSSRPVVQLASSTTAARTKLDRMIDRYVRDHMYADDAYTPFESAYIEAHADQTTSSYPSILTETASEILGRKEVAKTLTSESFFDTAFHKLNNVADLLEKKYGINKQLSMSSIFIASFTAPVLALMVGGIIFSSRQKEMTDRMAEQRYGKAFADVSATERIDEDIEAPDDGEDYDGDDDEDDDDDDEDDD